MMKGKFGEETASSTFVILLPAGESTTDERAEFGVITKRESDKKIPGEVKDRRWR